MTAATHGPDSPYAFNNDKPTAGSLLDALSEILDEFSQVRLAQSGVTTGARCLEVGAGAGSVAAWMADQVGPSGEVIALDIKPQHVRPYPGVTIQQNDVSADPLPSGEFDVIHARAVLQHLPDREEVLAKLVGALKPGGAVVVEELEPGWSRAVLATPDPRAYDVFTAYETALTKVLRSSGNDPMWCRRVHGVMRDLKLTGVDTQGWQRSFAGGTGQCKLAYSGSTELNDRLVAAGMAQQDLDLMRTLAMNPDLVLRGMLLLSTIGRKPVE